MNASDQKFKPSVKLSARLTRDVLDVPVTAAGLVVSTLFFGVLLPVRSHVVLAIMLGVLGIAAGGAARISRTQQLGDEPGPSSTTSASWRRTWGLAAFACMRFCAGAILGYAILVIFRFI